MPRQKGDPHLPGDSTKAEQRISSHDYDARALRDASSDGVTREYHGTAKLTVSWPGRIAAQFHGGRIVR